MPDNLPNPDANQPTPPQSSQNQPEGLNPPADPPAPGIYGEPPKGDPPAPKTDWPDDWRTIAAGEDEGLGKHLGRYSTVQDALKAGHEAAQKIRSGEWNQQPPQEATDEDMAKWREEHGVPVEAAAYDLPLPDGVEKEGDLDEIHQLTRQAFREGFHERHLTQETVSGLIEMTNGIAERQMEAQAQRDAEQLEKAEDVLREDWGAEFRANVNLNARYLADTFGEDWQMVLAARRPDGVRFAEDPDFARWVNKLAREAGGTALQGGEGVTQKASAARKAEIENVMATDYARYMSDPSMQEDYSRLLAASGHK